MIEILRWVLIGITAPVLVLLALHTIRRARALSKAIDEHHEAMEKRRNQPGPINPYEDLAAVFAPDRTDEDPADKHK